MGEVQHSKYSVILLRGFWMERGEHHSFLFQECPCVCVGGWFLVSTIQEAKLYFSRSAISVTPCLFFSIKILFVYRQRGREREREREKHQCVVASYALPTGDLACNPGVGPDQESHQRPSGLQAHVQSTELHQPRLPRVSEPQVPSF